MIIWILLFHVAIVSCIWTINVVTLHLLDRTQLLNYDYSQYLKVKSMVTMFYDCLHYYGICVYCDVKVAYICLEKKMI